MFEALRMGALGLLLNPEPSFKGNLILTETEEVWHDVLKDKECEELKWSIVGMIMQLNNLDATDTFREQREVVKTLEEGTNVGILMYRHKGCT